MTRSAIAIGLLWHSASSGNLGVGALTVANMAIVRQVAEQMGLTVRFTIIGMRDGVVIYLRPEDADIFVVDARAMLDPRRCLATVAAQDGILDIGAGDSFTDIYGLKRFVYLWATKMMAIVTRTPLLLSPQTIGPFSRPLETWLASMAMRRTTTVITRDEPSVEAMKVLAPRTPCVRSTDVAFALPYTDQGGQRTERPRVGINVSGLLFNEAVRGGNRFGLQIEYSVLVRSLIERFLNEGVDLHLVTHVNSDDPIDDDGGVADLLAREYPGVVRVPNFRGPIEAKSYISGLDFLVSARMHACIAAVSSKTPVVPIAYSRKFKGLFGAIGYPWTIDVVGKTTEEALEFIVNAYRERTTLAVDCAKSMTLVDDLHERYRAELRRFLETTRQG